MGLNGVALILVNSLQIELKFGKSYILMKEENWNCQKLTSRTRKENQWTQLRQV